MFHENTTLNTSFRCLIGLIFFTPCFYLQAGEYTAWQREYHYHPVVEVSGLSATNRDIMWAAAVAESNRMGEPATPGLGQPLWQHLAFQDRLEMQALLDDQLLVMKYKQQCEPVKVIKRQHHHKLKHRKHIHRKHIHRHRGYPPVAEPGCSMTINEVNHIVCP